MKVFSPLPSADDPLRVRDLVKGVLVFTGALFWVVYFVIVAKDVTGRVEIRWKPSHASTSAAGPGQ
jgi:hypothetical protein